MKDLQNKKKFPLYSLMLGFLALVTCCLPPLQFLLGGVGLLLAILSKEKDSKMERRAKVGLVLSIAAIAISVFITIQFEYTMTMMKDPRFTPYFHDFMNQYLNSNGDMASTIQSYQELLNQLQKVLLPTM